MKKTEGRIKHLENKFSIARWELIKECEGEELRFYLYLKLYAINKSCAFPAFKTIKKDLGWSESKIKRLAGKMVDKKHLKYTAGSGRKSSVYDITWYDRLNEGRGGRSDPPQRATVERGRKRPLRGGESDPRTSSNGTNKSKSTSSCKKPTKQTKLRAVVDHFFQLKEWELEDEPYSRHVRSATKLLERCGDDENKAKQVLTNCKEKADKDQWSDWTIETSLAKFGDFRPVSKEEKRAKTALAHDIAVASSQHISLEELRAQRGY